jgi:hypothetical protein
MIRRKLPALPSLRAVTIAVAGGLMALATVVAVAPPADAAAPRCTTRGWRAYVISPGQYSFDTWISFPAHSPEVTDGGYGFWSCSMVQGSTINEAIKALQLDINTCYPGLSPVLKDDGQFGSRTFAALKKVQESHGIENNGQYGPQTARTMYHRYWHGDSSTRPGCATLESFGWPGNSPR